MQYGLLGETLKHSFSKEVHAKIGDYDYILTEKAKDEVDSFMRERDFRAINVTIPYKETVIPYLETISKEAQLIGSVNTIINREGKLYGYNTDFGGMKMMIEKNGIEIKGRKVLILGTGGTCKTAKAVCRYLGASDILVASRSEKPGCITYDEAFSAHTDAQIIINTTPVGMYPRNDTTPADINLFPSLEGVIDAVYNPLSTNLVLNASKKGIKATGGLYMLVAQAILASEIFFDTSYPEELYDKIYNGIVADKKNIVLIGMPACGKTIVGKCLAESTGRQVIDTDDVIVEMTGLTISDIFEKDGEDVFRNIEAEAIAEVSKKSNIIISTGGGAVLRAENVHALKQNGVLYFLDRPLEKLIPTDDRPLANNKEKIVQRYNERYGIYTSVCDELINIEDDPTVARKEIERRHFG